MLQNTKNSFHMLPWKPTYIHHLQVHIYIHINVVWVDIECQFFCIYPGVSWYQTICKPCWHFCYQIYKLYTYSTPVNKFERMVLWSQIVCPFVHLFMDALLLQLSFWWHHSLEKNSKFHNTIFCDVDVVEILQSLDISFSFICMTEIMRHQLWYNVW